MLSPSPRKLLLSKLEEGSPGLSKSWGSFLAEATHMCLVCHRHPTGIEMKVQGHNATTFSVFWDYEVTDQLMRSWDDEQDMTEFGACGIAVLLILELTDYTIIQRAKKGTGVDYWLGHKNAELPFENAARLEVSGILKGDEQMLRYRVAKKKKQTEPTDGALPAYVVVVEFSRPMSHLAQK